MAFEKGNQYGKIGKRGTSKLSLEMRKYLEKVSDNMIKSINFKNLDDYTKLQYLKVFLPYLLAKKKEVDISKEWEQQPLFNVIIEEKE